MPISRLYENASDADAAVKNLRTAGFTDSHIKLISKSETPATPAALLANGISSARATSYASRVEEGAVLLILSAPFGTGRAAEQVLGGPQPGDSAVSKTTYEGTDLDDATPLSNALGWPVLMNDAAPFSRFLNIGVLARDQGAIQHSFGMPTSITNPAPLSKMLGWKLLSHAAAPFSGLFAFEMLSHNPTPLSSLLGWKVLSRWAGPTPSKGGVHKMSQNPAPFSSLFGWPVLIKK